MARFAYSSADNSPTSLMPRLPMTISLGERSIEVIGLLDTGAAVNVMPYSVGIALGAVWEAQTTLVPLVGSLGHHEARALVVMAAQPQMTQTESVRLVFAWTRSENTPIIFGQMNFFLEFDVCFYRSQNLFDVRSKNNASL